MLTKNCFDFHFLEYIKNMFLPLEKIKKKKRHTYRDIYVISQIVFVILGLREGFLIFLPWNDFFYSKRLLACAHDVPMCGWRPRPLSSTCNTIRWSNHPFLMMSHVATDDGWFVASGHFFSSFFSISSRESTCLSSFLYIFQFHFLYF